jgi:hypothetical protein
MKFKLSPRFTFEFNSKEHISYLNELGEQGLTDFSYHYVPGEMVFILDTKLPMPDEFVSKIIQKYYFSPLK